MFKWLSGKKAEETPKAHSLDLEELKEQLKTELNVGSDLVFRTLKRDGDKLIFCLMDSLIDSTRLDDIVIKSIMNHKELEWTCEAIAKVLPIASINAVNQLGEVVEGINQGKVYIYAEGQPFGILADVSENLGIILGKYITNYL